MSSLKQMLKLLTVICVIAGSSYAAAGNSVMKYHASKDKSAGCNTATDYCVYIKADSTISDYAPVSINDYFSIVQGGSTYKESYADDISQYYNVLFNGSVSAMKQNNVTELTVGVTTANGKAIDNCVIKAGSAQLTPGVHTLMLSKATGQVTCSIQ